MYVSFCFVIKRIVMLHGNKVPWHLSARTFYRIAVWWQHHESSLIKPGAEFDLSAQCAPVKPISIGITIAGIIPAASEGRSHRKAAPFKASW